MTSKVRDVFSALAQQLRITESDFQVLVQAGMDTADEFFFRLPDQAKMEEWLLDTVRVETCELARPAPDQEEVWQTVPRLENGVAPTERVFGRSALAASFRRLWTASKAAAQKDI